MVVAVDGVSPQAVDRQLLLQKTDDLKLRQVSAVTDIWTLEGEREREGMRVDEMGGFFLIPCVTTASQVCDGRH